MPGFRLRSRTRTRRSSSYRAGRQPNSRTRNALIRSLHGLGERGFALLTQRWTTLQNVTASPGRIGDIAKAAFVLVQFEHR